ncbi:LysR family transcriptional regulator [Paenibacillus baekrokdamisoli]|uniref:LysR family transcriptional regulator n=1 Tax=Paenibacillus baekrokdamisoli TaxID=1712516 RepID=A0A3G9J2F6_9BACL|nr:LysR family transcriptional regulator [Paenibacillus baekrokdamisoli]BBH20011.1 LysR family transcriptional regulator [Paenibacillus baekrokdamisoli]
MELRQLVTFRTVTSTLNFSRAAAALNYVPSNVTMQMQALEEELGVRLIDRLGKQLVLTDAGNRFLLYVDKVLNTLDEARIVMCESEQVTGTVTVSANEVLCAYRLPALFRRFREHHPSVRLIFRPTPSDYLKQSLCDGKADVVFLLDEPLRSTGLAIESLIEEPFQLLVAPNHPLLKWSNLLPEHFQGELFLLNEKGCTYRTLFDRALTREGIDSTMNLEFSSAEAIKQCAMVGLGIAFLPEMVVANELDRGELVALSWEMPELRVVTQMLWHKEKWLSPAISAFLDIARDTLMGVEKA